MRILPIGAVLVTVVLTPDLVSAEVSGPAVARDAARLAKVVLDPSLEKAAERHARELLDDREHARLGRVQAALLEEGLADAQVLPFAAIGADPEALAHLIRQFSSDTAAARNMTHAGIALVGREKHYALAAIFSRRVVELSPLPHTARGSRFVVRGRARAGDRVEALLLRPCKRPSASCDGEVVPLRATLTGDALSVTVPFDRGAGRYTLELLATRDRGPEVAAMWTFFANTRRASADEPVDHAGKNDERALELLVADERDRRELAPLARDAALDRAARAHAEAVCRSMIAAHVIDGTDPLARAKKAGFTGRGVAENVAIAPAVARAHANLLATPSHRINVLDPTAKSIGLGVAANDASTFCVVELFGL